VAAPATPAPATPVTRSSTARRSQNRLERAWRLRCEAAW
jgi:hypothetical protein